MLRDFRPRARFSRRRLGSAVAVLALAGAALGLGASAAAAVPADGAAPVVTSTSTQTAVLDTNKVYNKTGKYFYQDGVVDPARDVLYLADSTGTTADPFETALVRIDLATGASTVIPLGGGFAASDVAVSPLDGTVYVAHNTAPDASVSVLDPDVTYTETSLPPQIPVADHSQRLEAASDGRIFVVGSDADVISVIGASTGPDRMNVVQTIAGVETSASVTAMDSVHQRLYVASENGKTVTVIDAAASSASVLGVIALEKTPVGVTWDAVGDLLALTFDDNTISWLTPADDFSSAVVTRTETLAPLPDGADPVVSQPRALSVRADGTAMVLTEVWPTEAGPENIKSFVSVVPPVVDAATPIVSLTVGRDGFALVPDPRVGGSVYVTNIGEGTVSTIGDVTLTGYASSHVVGTDGAATASLVRADGFPLASTLNFTDASGAVFSAQTGADGFARAAVPGLAPGDAAFDVTVVAPATVTLAGKSTVTTVAAAVTPGGPTVSTPSDAAGQKPSSTLAATGFPAGTAAAGVLALLGLGAAGLLASRRARVRA
ncbi:hypothetical protein SAMN06295879_1124 [Agreia bicolorata]|uniref:40-residue YVTN family beta-propeller repeat-containing protein n=1 Tax=Agreia bicolorata TaxID=110935 RepID=A0A1T4XIK0_9MICO|nr:hypothetical protein [Agreia bicolorata]SKA88921.1 hypothetical protein SAMN06295879_1124 [Agreia bicolorata]